MKSPGKAVQIPQTAALPAAQQPSEGTAAANPLVHGSGGAILSEALLQGRNEVQILHRGELYRLCLTRAGKLILHK